MPHRKVSPLGLIALCVTTACVANGPAEHVGAAQGELARSGPWAIPADVLALAASQEVPMTEGGPWVGSSGCSGTFTQGARALGDYIRDNFPQVTSYGGYSCRAIVGDAQWMSVHGTGRALDLFIPVDRAVSGEANADNSKGDVVANWLIANAEYIGIQRVIWDRYLWQSDDWGDGRATPYNSPGSHPHNDHIHMELSVEGGQRATAFFSGPMDAPVSGGCAALPAVGGVVDNSSTCFQAFGNDTGWRHVAGAGIESSYVWTNAASASAPSNWGRWALNLSTAGTYTVEVHLVAEHAVFDRARYSIVHNEEADTVMLDQHAANGWVTLGDFDFVAGGAQSVALYDDAPGTVVSDQHLCFDAIRVINTDPNAVTDSPADDPLGHGGTPGSTSRVQNPGCSVSDTSSASRGATFFVLALGAMLSALRRRRHNESSTS
ncbi:MAG: hypothetical protein IPK60_19365 [Sandaracinaceae bacterium]|nr:hypothetical protein [Sandaracinaceae bacterium]